MHPLELEALGGGASLRHGHHPGVVDQQVQALVAIEDLVGQLPDRLEVGQVELDEPFAILARDLRS